MKRNKIRHRQTTSPRLWPRATRALLQHRSRQSRHPFRAIHAARARGELKPAAAIGHPPTHDEDWDGGSQRPPERQNEISDQAQEREEKPEDLSFHVPSLRRNSLGQWRTPAGSRDRWRATRDRRRKPA